MRFQALVGVLLASIVFVSCNQNGPALVLTQALERVEKEDWVGLAPYLSWDLKARYSSTESLQALKKELDLGPVTTLSIGKQTLLKRMQSAEGQQVISIYELEIVRDQKVIRTATLECAWGEECEPDGNPDWQRQEWLPGQAKCASVTPANGADCVISKF